MSQAALILQHHARNQPFLLRLLSERGRQLVNVWEIDLVACGHSADSTRRARTASCLIWVQRTVLVLLDRSATALPTSTDPPSSFRASQPLPLLIKRVLLLERTNTPSLLRLRVEEMLSM